MLGLCWKPAAIQGMQKVASSMPTNPEQLLGAILVRRDIFQRFETTMQDTCLDANNLLEYLFSLYNSTATPADRENRQSNQNIRPQAFNNATRRDSNPGNKKSVAQPPHVRQVSPKGHAPGMANQVQGIPDVLINDAHNRKRAKLDQNAQSGNNHNVVSHQNSQPQQHQQPQQQQPQQPQPGYPTNLLRPFDPNPAVFPGTNNIKMEMAHDAESRLTQSSSPLPPFSQIRRQSRPFSPGSAQNIGPATPATDAAVGPKYNLDGSLDQSCTTPDTSLDQSDNNGSKNESTPLKDNNGGLPRRKRPKRHQCFCGALFTRADNLKRHIRKCHEEKLEKLTGTATGEGGDQAPTNATFEEFQQLYPAAGQDMQQQEQGQPQQQLTQQEQEHHRLQQQQQQQQQQQHQQQQLQQQQPHQQEDQRVLTEVGDLSMTKAPTSGSVKWSCFCGESFEDHRQLVEHTRIHEGNP